MIISLKWLKNYINLDGISVEEIVDKLTTSGSEVEEVIDKSSEFKNIVVGYVESVSKHPNADRLSVCKVSDGNELFDVVCGAPNVSAGQKVPFAKVGAIIPNGKFEIKSAKIRGEKSSGMICAEDELGLSEDHSGIMVLSENAEVGKPLVEELKLDDVIIDVAITPNRSDALSHIGIARDLATIFDKKLIYPEINFEYKVVSKNDIAEVDIENAEGCPRYSAVIVKNVEVKESPEWLKEKLTSIGSRPINNIVDVTNFILHEMGQPLHAFDLKHLSDNKIVVKNNLGEGEFITLDSKKRSMLPTDLMIWDGQKPVAIAGVMGGENSEVTADTKDILIESAFFDPSYVRKTAKHLGLSTDASYRFERGTNPSGTLDAALRAALLIIETAGGEIIKEVIDVYPNEILSKEISVRFSRISKILGFDIPKEKIYDIFEGLEFNIINKSEEEITVSVPTFRHDIEREIDLIEEIVRIYGFENIPPIENISLALTNKVDETSFLDDLRKKLTAFGFDETVSNSLISEDKSISYTKSVKVLNPQSTEMSVLRNSLLPGMLMNISRNLKVKENQLKFFETGHVFSSNSNTIKSFEDFSENENLIIAICGKRQNTEWYQKESYFDIYDLSGNVNGLLSSYFDIEKLESKYTFEGDDYFEYLVSKSFNNVNIGSGGKVSNELLDKYDIPNEVFVFEINADNLKQNSKDEKKYQPLLKYPKVYRDFAFVLDKEISYYEVEKTIKDSNSKLLKKVNLFDIFESESLGSSKKSLAFQLEYFDEARTLREDEVDSEFWNTIEVVKKKFNAELRG
ncbi:MAG: phenylalanine--tRNA ligase subunit beta [Ignavibacteriales bacterium]|nr:phenylalanine--tRNA ligase subunit beta [Ignavibacteriales bacterium]